MKKEEILKLRKQGLTINQIVDKLHCAKSTVSYHINNHNLGGNIESFLFGVSNEKIKQIKILRNDNKTYKEISNLIEISEDKLIKICRKYNLNKPINVLKKEFNKTDVINFYQKVKSIRKTAKNFSTSRETIRKILPDEIVSQSTNNRQTKTKSQSVIEWRKRKKIELVEYKGGKCERCDYHKSLNALTFHHKDPSLKDFTISSKSYSIERLKKEVDKCILLCSNCHIELHEELNMIK